MCAEIMVWKMDNGRITISFPYNPDYVSKVKKVSGYRWHPAEKYWSFPYTRNTLETILTVFDGERIVVDPALRRELGQQFEDLRKELAVRRYSAKTIKSYIHYNKQFLDFAKKSPKEVTNEDVRNFLAHLSVRKGVSTSSLNIAINALKFYYGEVLRQNFVYEIKRPTKDKKLPVVLSGEEISRLLSSVNNIKHKAILMLTYSAGLRVGEVVRLKVEDIDAQRKLIHIRGAKGRKDR